MSDLFVTRKNNYSLRNFPALESSHKRTVKFGTDTISYRGPQIWSLIPERLRTLVTLSKFEKEIKNGSVVPAHVECAIRTFNVLPLPKTVVYFPLRHCYSNTTYFSIFINRTLSLRIHTADIISL